ncbi:hypothetical protein ASAP_2333 [Asaia bogorensis]|uniref:Uncharacterized protein n=1 Tax=Asaia bogorensis TaxID=91915 RepID=A0A060QI56_9PROT|nr:hypothetical protein ASAP_2333 [Asaia bogorensis]
MSACGASPEQMLQASSSTGRDRSGFVVNDLYLPCHWRSRGNR